MNNQKGQVILLLILVMTVALAIGLSIVQKSLVDVSTASKVEQSSRAFSAAEAGIEKALQESNTTVHSTLEFTDNSSQVTQIIDTGLIPVVPTDNSRQAVLEYPPLAKEEVVQVWLADLNSISNPPAVHYAQSTLDVYWGNSATDKAALELTLVYYGTDPADTVDPSTVKYRSKKRYLDQISRGNSFEVMTATDCPVGGYKHESTTIYQCKKILNFTPIQTSGLMLIRTRLLYNAISQSFAVQAVGTCRKACSLPPQAKSIVSTGASGETQRKVQVFQLNKVVPNYFDYAIFSVGTINK